jgi:hypothetical protein
VLIGVVEGIDGYWLFGLTIASEIVSRKLLAFKKIQAD